MHRTETGPPAHRGWPGFTIRVCPVAGGPIWCDDSTVRVTAVNVDDHAGFRAMARRLLQGAGFDVVGEAVEGAGADLARATRETLVVLISVRRSSDDRAQRITLWPARRFSPKTELSGDALVGVLAATA